MEINGDTVTVKTTQTDEYNFTADHEYDFVKYNDEWKLKEIYYADDDGKYECL